MPDQDEVIDGASIGNDESHGSESKAFEAFALTSGILQRVIDPYVVGFQKPVDLIAGSKTQKAPQFSLSDMTAFVFL
jgi:hypothetical protein